MTPLDDLNIKTMEDDNDWENIVGFIKSVEVVPTDKPRSVSEQFVIVSGGASTRVYIYDRAALAWIWSIIRGFLTTNSEDVPINTPTGISEQIVLVRGGGSTRAYIYDPMGPNWKYVALT